MAAQFTEKFYDAANREPGVKVFQWTLSNANAGADRIGVPIDWVQYSDFSAQVTGNFATSAVLSIKGSNDDGANYATLNDIFGVAATFSGAGLKQIAERPLKVYPQITTPGAADAEELVVTMVLRKIPLIR